MSLRNIGGAFLEPVKSFHLRHQPPASWRYRQYMSSLLKARAAFIIAIGLLLACALIAYGAVRSFVSSVHLVEHSQHVEVLLGETESVIALAARARLTYVFDGDDQALAQYQRAASQISVELSDLRESTQENPAQQAYCDRLEQLVGERIQLWEKSVALKKSGLPAPLGQPDLTRQSVAFADEITSLTQHMRAEESRLSQRGRVEARTSFWLEGAILVTSFITAVLLLFWHYRLVRGQLQARELAEQQTRAAALQASEAEHKARESEKAALASDEAARHLSARLMQLQDEERRRLARDLHDSTGQFLAAAKMTLSSLAPGHEKDPRYAECMRLLDRSLQEIRTLSHLLHPSGLEEAGLPAAARWYAEEFAKRSGIQLKVDVPDLRARMPREIEIALFRILQEGLGNIHRHSKSASAEIALRSGPREVLLTIKDDGVGIPGELLNRFRSSGNSGVGLAAMRERVRELRGNFELDSNGSGTSLRVTIPIPEQYALGASD
jgi:signal transduction histidine kinase